VSHPPYQIALGAVPIIGKAISNTPGVYNPISVGTTSVTFGMTRIGAAFVTVTEGVLFLKVLLDAGVFTGALVVCSL
jgi:hypothetical protein